MTVNADILPRLKTAFRPYVYDDQRRFISSFNVEDLEKGTIFDLQHQGLLRIAQMDVDRDTDFDSYASSPSYRRQLLQELQNSYFEAGTKYPDHFQLPVAGMRYGNDSYKALEEIIAGETIDHDERAFCFVCNSAGVGIFELDPYHLLPDGKDLFVTKSSLASIGASMYYAFNTSSSDAYLQTASINTLARSLSALQTGGWEIPSLQHAQTMRTLASMNSDENDLARSLTAMFGSHELGHRPTHPGNSYLLDILQEIGAEGHLIYRVGFPTTHDLGAWKRLKAGIGSLGDVLFMLGDTLANIAWLQTDPREDTVKSLELFLSWLLKEPRPGASPRGNLALYQYLIDRDMAALLNRTRALIETCAKDPANSAKILSAAETAAWDRLKPQLAER